MCNYKLDNIVNNSDKTCHRTIKMTSVDVKESTYIDSDVGNIDKDSVF